MPGIDIVVKLHKKGVKAGIDSLANQIRSLGRADVGKAMADGIQKAITPARKLDGILKQLKKTELEYQASVNSARNIVNANTSAGGQALKDAKAKLKQAEEKLALFREMRPEVVEGARKDFLGGVGAQPGLDAGLQKRQIDYILQGSSAQKQLNKLIDEQNSKLHHGVITQSQHAEKSRELQAIQNQLNAEAARVRPLAEERAGLTKGIASGNMDHAELRQAKTRIDEIDQAINGISTSLKQLPGDHKILNNLMAQYGDEVDRAHAQVAELKAAVQRAGNNPMDVAALERASKEIENSAKNTKRAREEMDRLDDKTAGFGASAKRVFQDANLNSIMLREAVTEIQQAISGLESKKISGMITPAELKTLDEYNRALDLAKERQQNADNAAKAGRKGIGNFNNMMMQASYGVQDFVQVIGQTGLQGALHASANNFSQVAALMGGMKGPIIGVGLTMGAILIPMLLKGKSAAEKLAESVEGLSEALARFRSEVEIGEEIGELAAGGDLKAVTKSREKSAKKIDNLERQLALRRNEEFRIARDKILAEKVGATGDRNKGIFGGALLDLDQAFSSMGKQFSEGSFKAETELEKLGRISLNRRAASGDKEALAIQNRLKKGSSLDFSGFVLAQLGRDALKRSEEGKSGALTSSDLTQAFGADRIEEMTKDQVKERRKVQIELENEVKRYNELIALEKQRDLLESNAAKKRLDKLREEMRTEQEKYEARKTQLQNDVKFADTAERRLAIQRAIQKNEEDHAEFMEKKRLKEIEDREKLAKLNKSEEKHKSLVSSVIGSIEKTPLEKFQESMAKIAAARANVGRVGGIDAATAGRLTTQTRRTYAEQLQQTADRIGNFNIAGKAGPEKKFLTDINGFVERYNKTRQEMIDVGAFSGRRLQDFQESARSQLRQITSDPEKKGQQHQFMGVEQLSRNIQQALNPTQEELDRKKLIQVMESSNGYLRTVADKINQGLPLVKKS